MANSLLICIVDDMADYRFILQQLFTRALPQYPVRFFASGQSLLDELPLLDQLPGLILLDRHMPRLDGHQTLVRSKQAYPLMPVVIMSADASALEINGCYASGANGFVMKRLDFDGLIKSLQVICNYWIDTNQGPV